MKPSANAATVATAKPQSKAYAAIARHAKAAVIAVLVRDATKSWTLTKSAVIATAAGTVVAVSIVSRVTAASVTVAGRAKTAIVVKIAAIATIAMKEIVQ